MHTINETPAIISPKRYKCERCGHEEIHKTNHYGPTWSLGHHYATCPKCPPWAKYPEFGGNTTWICVDTPPAQQGEPTSFSAWLEQNGDSIECCDNCTEIDQRIFDNKRQ